jgi:hypothetical protein
MEVYKLCRCNFRVKHIRVRKHQHKNEFVFFKILLANYKVVWRGSSHEQDIQEILLVRGKMD